MTSVVNPALYQLNLRLRLYNLGQELGRRTTLNDISNRELDEWARLGFDWIYGLGIWQTGTVGPEVSRTHPNWRQEYSKLLPEFTDADICGSPFAVVQYSIHEDFGNEESLNQFRDRLHQRGLKLMLDFVPNHTAPDCPWVQEHPDFYIAGTEEDLAREPQNYTRLADNSIFARGRDPYFAGWPDTLQLNYGNPDVATAAIAQLLQIARYCDGVRCDMAMLVLADIFERTWGIPCEAFWPKAIATVKQEHPEFIFMAEVYWGLEWVLQQQGFDYTYDKRLYDRLHNQTAEPVRQHFGATLTYQQRSVRFLENHDEPRAADIFPRGAHQAAALLTYLCPGLRFFHHGQLRGWTQKMSLHLRRSAPQSTNEFLQQFYQQLLGILREPIVREGNWQLLECHAAWEYNGTWANFIAFAWEREREGQPPERAIAAVNYAPSPGQCYVRLPFAWDDRTYVLQDAIGSERYEREGQDLAEQGLYLDVPGWKGHVFWVD